MGFLVALRFLTALPLPAKEVVHGELGRSTAYFPLVGLFLGLLLAWLDALLQLAFPISVSSAVVLVALVLLTGALHLDGLMDSCDGLFGRREPARRLEIMRDSRVGSFGVLGAIGLLLVKYAAIGALPGAWRFGGLALMPTLGRLAMVVAVWGFPYARPQGLGRPFKEDVTWREVTVATLSAVLVAWVALQQVGIAALLVGTLATWLLASFIRGRIAGLTGDSYGAINEVVEVVSLLAIVAMVRTGRG